MTKVMFQWHGEIREGFCRQLNELGERVLIVPTIEGFQIAKLGDYIIPITSYRYQITSMEQMIVLKNKYEKALSC